MFHPFRDFCSFWILFLDTSQLGFKDQDSRKKEKNTKNKCKHLPNNLSVQNVLVSYGNNILGVRKIGSEQEKKNCEQMILIYITDYNINERQIQ